ncbi:MULTISPECIES: hypothetical protein [Methylobacteriaceae]
MTPLTAGFTAERISDATVEDRTTFWPSTRIDRAFWEQIMLVRFGLGAALTVMAGSAAFAAPMSDEDKAVLQQQCAGDFTTFCAGLPPEDGPETQACFQKNMSQLSPGCQSAIKAYKKKG